MRNRLWALSAKDTNISMSSCIQRTALLSVSMSSSVFLRRRHRARTSLKTYGTSMWESAPADAGATALLKGSAGAAVADVGADALLKDSAGAADTDVGAGVRLRESAGTAEADGTSGAFLKAALLSAE
jgi:hypothetical protein